MNLLIVMTGMGSGGAEKSLISLLNALDGQPEINIDLLVFSPRGMFFSQIPNSCNILNNPKEVYCMSATPADSLFRENMTLRGVTGKIYHGIKKKLNKGKGLDDIQAMWLNWKKFIPPIKKHYDVAISYMHGATNYFVIDKCDADKKYLYVHHEYAELPADHDFDRTYFSKATGILTVSPRCVESILEIYPEMKGKVHSLENIMSSKLIKRMSDEFFPEEYQDKKSKQIILSIGRLIEVKRFDRVIDAAEILKNRGKDIVWYIIGRGHLKQSYERAISERGLTDNIILLGEKPNPYPYIKYCDIFVQTSDNEGKSIVVDEAKILNRPIVVTNYKTVGDVIEDGVSGLIAEMNPESVAEKLEVLLEDDDLRSRLVSYLSSQDYSNDSEVYKFLCLLQ